MKHIINLGAEGEIIQSIDNIDLSLNPFQNKLFNGDEIELEGDHLKINYSLIRNTPYLPGILIIVGKTYGRSKGSNMGKLIYKCIPNVSIAIVRPISEYKLEYTHAKNTHTQSAREGMRSTV